MNCPACRKDVKDFYQIWSDKPFTAKETLPGLAAWGGIDIERTTLCQRGQFVHFKFDQTGDEHLVEMVPDLPQKREVIHEHYETMTHQCEEEGCTKTGYPGWSLWGEMEPIGFYCGDHLFKNGFCTFCHYFYSGFSSFDFGDGLCDDCDEMVRQETGDFDDADDWDTDL